MKKIEKKIEDQINFYLKKLDEFDKKEQSGNFSLNREKIQEVTNRLGKKLKRKEKVEFIKNIFSENPELIIHFATDKDTRLQNDKGILWL